MKHMKECPICFEPRASCSGEYECNKHGIPYDMLGEWVNEQVQDVEECYQDQIPVLQPLFQDASDFGARVQDSGRMNERLKHTIAFITEVQKELGSYHLRILGLLSNGLELTQADGEWCIQTPDGKVWRCAEEEIQPLRELRYIQGARITELGREALRIYKMAHPLLLYDIDQI